MEKLFKAMTSHKKTIVVLFSLAVIVCGILAQSVSVNYNMMDYLPDSVKSTKSLDVMEVEFEGGIPSARAMTGEVSIPEALLIKEQLLQIDGITDVTWLDDVASIEVPLDVLDTDIVEEYYKDNRALFSITLEREKEISAIHQIKEIIGETGAMDGSSVDTVAATETTGKEVKKIILFVVPLCFIILLLTTSSWFEPVLFMLTIGVAIILNNGTNLIFGEISFVTNASSSILQLAVSMDYSIFLLHRFAEYRKKGYDVQEAMVKGLTKSVNSILSSGLTTVIGFAALILMRFKIGPDMGLVMAKGILFSLISVIILLPVLSLISYKLIDKTHHMSFMPSFQGLSKLIYKIRIPVLLLFFIVLVPAYLAGQKNSFYYGSSQIFSGQETQVGKERSQIEHIFGKSNKMVLMVPKGDFATETLLSNTLQELPEVNNILSYVDNAGAEVPVEYLDEAVAKKLLSEHYSRMVITVNTEMEGEKSFALVEQVREIANTYYGSEYYLAGDSVNTYDMMTTVTEDNKRVNFIAIGSVLLVLIFAFRSLLLPIVLVLAIETSIWLNLSVPYFSSEHIFYIAYLIISSIQLGATVDYAILFANRYQELREQYKKKEALLKTLESTLVSILTSASILTLSGFLLGFISTNKVLSQLGILIGRGALFSTFIVLLVLPAMLYTADRFLLKRKSKKVEKSNSRKDVDYHA